MDLESECSALEFVEDNEVTQHTVTPVHDNIIKDNHVDGYNIKDNGSFANANQSRRFVTDEGVDSDALTAHNHVKGSVEVLQPMHSAPLAAKYPGGTSPHTTKGYGLKTWKRIKRDFVKDPTAAMDNSKILKRGLSGSANPTKPQHMTSPEIKQNSESPVGPVNMLKNASVAHRFRMNGPSLDSRFAVGSAFAAATDSENSEDRSSKSSTAASVPKVSYDLPAVLGYVHEKNQMKSLRGKNVGNSSQRVQQGKGCVESTKKPRGERVKIEKENSHSSMESDSRSSNFVFVQGPFSMIRNGKQSGKSMNCDWENSDEAQGEYQINKEFQTAYRKENSSEIEVLSPDYLAADLSWEAKEEKSENHWASPDQDPLVKSILALQSVQEAFQNEVQKLGVIGKEPTSVHDFSVNINSVPVGSTFADQKIHETSSSDLASEKIRNGTPASLETQVFTLTQKAKYLESKLEEARAVLRAKESRISELETIVNSSRSRKEESGRIAESQQDTCKEMEFDLESLFQQKMEAEIEFLTLTRAVQKSRTSVGNHITLFEEQTSSAEDQAQVLKGETESKAAKLKKQVEELEMYCGDALRTEEILKMQRRVCKFAACFFTQLVFLVLVLWFVVLQLSPHSGVVPT